MREARPASRQRSISRLNAVGGRRPVGAGRQLLGLGDELLLGGLGLGLGALELGEVHPPGLVEAVAGRAEPLPQRRLGLAVELGTAALHAPSTHPAGRACGRRWPSTGSCSRAGPAMDSASATSASRCAAAGLAGGPALGVLGAALGLHGGGDGLHLASSAARSPTTPGLGVCSRSLARPSPASLAPRSVCVTRCSSSSAEAQQLVVLAGEVGQRLRGGGAGVGADLALALGGADEDGAVVVDPAELGGAVAAGGVQTGERRGAGRPGAPGEQARERPGAGAAAREPARRPRARRSARWRGSARTRGQAFFSVTATLRMLIGWWGAVLPAGRPARRPAAAILSTISMPPVTLPKME